MKYDSLIKKLENIIEHWYDKETLKTFIEEPHDGLCDNIRFGSAYIPYEVFESWTYFTGDTRYPVGGENEYKNGTIQEYSLFNNPKRLHIAVHMLQWLRFNNH